MPRNNKNAEGKFKHAATAVTVKEATIPSACGSASTPLTLSAPATELRQALCEDRWFASCGLPFQDALFAHGRLRQLTSGETLYSRDQQTQALYCVVAGAVRIGVTHVGGSSALLVYLEPYHWFGELQLIDGQSSFVDARAEGETTVLCVSRSGIEGWLKSHPEYWRDLARLASGKLRIAYEVLMEPGSLPQRLAKRLLLLTEGFGSRVQHPRRKLRLSQEQLADMLGASRQSINKALHTLETAGAISLHYGRVEVLDIETLHASATPE